MIHYKHILIATDLSKGSEAIARQAIGLAAHANATVSIVHVIEHTPIVYGGGEFSVPLDVNLEQNIEKQARAALEDLCGKLDIPSDHQYLKMGSVKATVNELSHQLGADLIVVGRYGYSGLQRLLGSTANAILHVASCDVLALAVAK